MTRWRTILPDVLIVAALACAVQAGFLVHPAVGWTAAAMACGALALLLVRGAAS